MIIFTIFTKLNHFFTSVLSVFQSHEQVVTREDPFFVYRRRSWFFSKSLKLSIVLCDSVFFLFCFFVFGLAAQQQHQRFNYTRRSAMTIYNSLLCVLHEICIVSYNVYQHC